MEPLAVLEPFPPPARIFLGYVSVRQFNWYM